MQKNNLLILLFWLTSQAYAWDASTLSYPSNNSINNYTGITVNWNAVVNSEGYILEIDTNSNFSSSLYQSISKSYISSSNNNADTEHFFEDFLFAQKYYWRVKAYVTGDTSSWSSRQFTTRDQISLDYPSNNATNIYTGVNLNWYSSHYVDFYQVELDTSQSFNSSLYVNHTDSYIGTSSSNTDTHEFYEDLLFGQKYYWRVRAINGSDTSSWSLREFTTRDYVSLDYPSNNATNIYTGVNLNWYSSHYVDFYQVELDTSQSFNSSLYVNHTDSYIGTSSSNTDTHEFYEDLLFGQKYYWRVRAINGSDTSSWSLREFTTRDYVSLDYPSNNATNIYTGVNLNWYSSHYVDFYQVELDTSQSFNSSLYVNHTDSYIGTSSSNTDTHEFYEDLLFGQKYYWRVRAINGSDTSSWSLREFTTRDYVSLDYPSNNATNIYTGVSLNWYSSHYVDFYQVELDTNQNFNSSLYVHHTDSYIGTSSSNTDTHEFYEDLLFGQKYYWRVRAINGSDTSSWSLREFTTRDYVSLDYPSNNSTNIYTGVSLNWYSSHYVDFYQVELDTNQNFNSSLYVHHTDSYIGTSSSNTDTHEFYENLLFGQKYYWRVRAINGSDTSSWSLREFTTREYITLQTPNNNTVNVSTSNVNLNWNSSHYVDFYEVQWDTTSFFNSVNLQSQVKPYIGTSSSATDTYQSSGPLLVNQTYYWRVRAINANDTSLWQSRVFSTGSTIQNLSAPTLVSPANTANNVSLSPSLSWSSVSSASSYIVEYSLSSSFAGAQQITTPNLSTSLNGLVANSTYYWRVKASNSQINSQWSNAWSFVTLSSCVNPDQPIVQVTINEICEGESTTISIQSGNLNDATTWSLYESSCGVGFVATNTIGTFNVSPSLNKTYYVRGEGGCVTTSTCGSIDVVVKPTYDETEDVDLCKGSDYTFPDGTVVSNIQSNMSHVSNLQSINSCDSSVTTEINILTVNTSISLQGSVLVASEPNLQYQWINCLDNTNVIGEVNQTFSVVEDGTYAVVITDNNCIDTSLCEIVNGLSLDEKGVVNISIYPNPTTEIIHINTDVNFDRGVLMDLSGRVLFSVSSSIKSIDLSKLPKGIYVLQLELEGVKYQKRIIKE